MTMSAALDELQELQKAAREAASLHAVAADYRTRAPNYRTPETREHVLTLAEEYERRAEVLAPQESRLRRAIAALERALADDDLGA